MQTVSGYPRLRAKGKSKDDLEGKFRIKTNYSINPANVILKIVVSFHRLFELS